jgi:undecaprenyl-diphosphatase
MIMATNVGVPLLVALVVAQWWSKIDRTHVRHTCIAAGLSFLIGLGPSWRGPPALFSPPS